MQSTLIASELAYGAPVDNRTKHLLQNVSKWKRRRSLSKMVESPILPGRDVVKGALFFKQLFFYADRYGYLEVRRGEKVMHIMTLRRFLRRLQFLLDQSDNDSNSQAEWSNGLRGLPTWIKWEDIQKALDLENGEHVIEIRIHRTLFERLNAILDDNDSKIGSIWTAFVMSCICVSLASIVLGQQRFPPKTDEFCIIVFTIEYVLKLLCVGYCRRVVMNFSLAMDDLVPSNDPNDPMPAEDTPTIKRLRYICSPANLIDLLAILPFWLRVVFATAHLNLGFLRAVRILRVLRIMKFGSFTKDFKLMGEVFSKSTGAIAAIALTLLMVSMLLGAVMAQLESGLIPRDLDGAIWEDNKEWSELVGGDVAVPHAMLWVAGRMTNMQSSMSAKAAIPASWPNQVIVHIMGIMKGFIFLLPLGQMQKFFRDQDKARRELDELEFEVVEEKRTKVGMEWSCGHNRPFALIEVFDAEDRIGIGAKEPARGRGAGILNLPLSEGRTKEPGIVLCPITGLLASGVLTNDESFPSIFFEVMWASVEEDGHFNKRADGDDVFEDGVLTIRVVSGVNFPSEGTGWKLRISVPEHLFGRGARATRYTCASANTPEEPWWDIHVQFNVDWAQSCRSIPESPKRIPRQKSRLETCMKEQLATLSNIEDAVHDKLRVRHEKVQSARLPLQDEQGKDDKLTVLSPRWTPRTCTIVDVELGGDKVKIHYDGFEDKYDEWLPTDSQRIIDRPEAATQQNGSRPDTTQWLQPDRAPAQSSGPGQSFLPPVWSPGGSPRRPESRGPERQ